MASVSSNASSSGSSRTWVTCGIVAAAVLCMLVCLTAAVLAWMNKDQLLAQFGINGNPPAAIIPRDLTSPAAQPTVSSQQPVVETKVPTASLPMETFEGTTFQLDPAISSSVSHKKTSEIIGGTDAAPWETAPQSLEFSLQGYMLGDTFHEPKIIVYPVQRYIELEPDVKKTIDTLSNQLSSRPITVKEAIPFLPRWPAAQVMHSNLKYLDFKTGSGVRFLSLYAQYMPLINNRDLFYTFQGITTDKKYYISAVLPVHNPILPPDSKGMNDAIQNQYDSYLKDILAKIEGQAPGTFTPSLDNLDALIRSLEIK